MYVSHSRYAFEQHPTMPSQPSDEPLVQRISYETPTTILSRLSTSTPHAQQQQQQTYYYYHDDLNPSISDHLEYRAAPLGFGVKKPKAQGHVAHHSDTRITTAYQYESPKREKQSRKRPRSKGQGDLTWVEYDGRTSPTIYQYQERSTKTNKVDGPTAFLERVYTGQVDSSWPDVPTRRQRSQYKDQSTQTDPVTMTVEEMYAALIAHQAQQEIIESSTQDSSGWTGESGVEVDSLMGCGSDESYHQPGELGGFGVEVEMNAASSGSTYSFSLPNESVVQCPSSSGTSGEGDMMVMGTNFDSLDPLDPAAVMEMAILEGWADMDFGLLGAGTEVEADTTGTIDPARIDWMVGQPMRVEEECQVPPPSYVSDDAPSYPAVQQSIKKVRRSKPASPAKAKTPKRVGRPRKEETQVIEPFPYGLPTVLNAVGDNLDPSNMSSNEPTATEHPDLSMTSVFTTQSLTYADVALAELGYPIEKDPSTSSLPDTTAFGDTVRADSKNLVQLAYDTRSDTLSPPPPLEEMAGARRYRQPPGAGRQLPRGAKVPEEKDDSFALFQHANTSLAENVKSKQRKSCVKKSTVKERRLLNPKKKRR